MSTVMKRRNQSRRNQQRQFTKAEILDRIDQYQVLYGCDRRLAFTLLRDECPDLWEALGQFFRDDAREQIKAA